MKQNLRYFNIFPRIVTEGKKTTIKVQPLYDHKKTKDGAKYEVLYIPMETGGDDEAGIFEKPFEIQPIDGCFEISLTFMGEQEHRIMILETMGAEQREYCSFSVYSVKEDLYNLRPYKGDLHMHSYYSDGNESPAYVVGACRKIGLDFMAITDHELYHPSLEAQKAYKNLEIDLLICPGEEIHPPDNEVHMINFGGNFSVNDLIRKDKERYFKEVEEIRQKENIPLSKQEQYKYASCKWCFDKIREGGGLSIYCHPYWVFENRYNVSVNLHNYIYQKQPFDAYEIIGGFYVYEAESNLLQVTYYQEERAKGKAMPIVGVSDAHGCDNGELFGWYYTVVLAPELKFSSIIEGIKNFNSVAVEALPGNPVRVYGPYRLVKYVSFLIREIFPIHDELCYEEGKLMLRYLAGDHAAADILKLYKGRVAKKMNTYWS